MFFVILVLTLVWTCVMICEATGKTRTFQERSVAMMKLSTMNYFNNGLFVRDYDDSAFRAALFRGVRC